MAFLATFGVQIFQLITADRLYNINGWVGVWYGADYSIGFGHRLFMGTILRVILGYYISAEAAKAVVILFLVIGAAMISLVIAAAIGKCTDDATMCIATHQVWTLFYCPLVLVDFGMVIYLWLAEDVGIKKGIEDLGRHVKQLPILFGTIVV